MRWFSLAAAAVFAFLIAASARMFGYKASYLAYAPDWQEAASVRSMNAWSFLVVLTALLLAPATIGRGAGEPWQWLGFAVPVLLALTGFAKNTRTGAVLDVLMWSAVAVFVIAAGVWPWLLIGVCAFAVVAILTHSVSESYILWLECALLLAVCGTCLT